MKLIAQKPCTFAGKKFYIGDEIPEEYVLNPKAQEKMGTLAIAPDDEDNAPEPASATVEITVHAEEGDVALNVPVEEFQTIFNVLTATADNGVDIIPMLNSGDSLVLLSVVDDRKTIRAAVEARGKALASEESVGEQ